MSESRFSLSCRARWLVWGAYTALWTLSLLTTFPITVRDALIPPSAGGPAGKSLHVAAYAFFTVLSGWVGIRDERRWLLLGFVSLHAFLTEYLQQYVDRTSSLADVGLDHLGLALGLAVSWRWWFVRSP